MIFFSDCLQGCFCHQTAKQPTYLQSYALSCCCQVMLHMLQQSCLEGLTLLSCGGTLDQLQQQTGDMRGNEDRNKNIIAKN
jgi:hypothetical protein